MHTQNDHCCHPCRRSDYHNHCCISFYTTVYHYISLCITLEYHTCNYSHIYIYIYDIVYIYILYIYMSLYILYHSISLCITILITMTLLGIVSHVSTIRYRSRQISSFLLMPCWWPAPDTEPAWLWWSSTSYSASKRRA